MRNRTKWSIDPQHSNISFRVKHLLSSFINGSFKIFDASIYTTGAGFSNIEIDMWIDVLSIDTGDEKRDERLKGSDFFDAGVQKQISFTSDKIGSQAQNGSHVLPGELTIKNVSRPVKLQVSFDEVMTGPAGIERTVVAVRGKVNRSDWGVIFNAPLEAVGVPVSDEVTIFCDIHLIKGEYVSGKAPLIALAELEQIF